MKINKIKATCKNCDVTRHIEGEESVICKCGSEMKILKYSVFKREKGAGVAKPKENPAIARKKALAEKKVLKVPKGLERVKCPRCFGNSPECSQYGCKGTGILIRPIPKQKAPKVKKVVAKVTKPVTIKAKVKTKKKKHGKKNRSKNL